MSRRTTTTTIAAAALVLAACGTSPDSGDEDTQPEEQETDGEETPETDGEETPETDGEETPEADGGDAPEDGGELGAGEDPLAGLPDPNDLVEAGVFRGEGITLPAPEGWEFDPMALTQGLVLASNDSGLQQVAGQAIDVDQLPEPLSFDDLVESNREQVPDEPALDEEIEIDGAAEARQLRYDGIPAQQEGQPDTSLLLIVADDGDGRLAVFNYAAASDEYEDQNAEQLVSAAGFDADSDPTPPQAPAPTPEEAPTG